MNETATPSPLQIGLRHSERLIGADPDFFYEKGPGPGEPDPSRVALKREDAKSFLQRFNPGADAG